MYKSIVKKFSLICITTALTVGAGVTTQAQSLENILKGDQRSADWVAKMNTQLCW